MPQKAALPAAIQSIASEDWQQSQTLLQLILGEIFETYLWRISFLVKIQASSLQFY